MKQIAVEGCIVEVSGVGIDSFAGAVITSIPSLTLLIDDKGSYAGALVGTVATINITGGFVASAVAFNIPATAEYAYADDARVMLLEDSVDVPVTGVNPTTGATTTATASIKITNAGQSSVEAE